MNILVLMPDNAVRLQFLPSANAQKLEALGHVIWNPHADNYPKETLQLLLREADAVVTGWGCPRIGEELLSPDAHPGILVHTGGTVAPYVDSATFQLGIRVCSANDLYAKSVAEGTLAYILAGLRRIPYWDREVRMGGWRTDSFTNYSLTGKKVGLVGFGAISRHLLPLLRPFKTEVLVYSHHLSPTECQKEGVTKASLEEIFTQCDVISLHSALTPRTHHMVDQSLLGRIKPGALLVNTARGGLVDEKALAEQLHTGRFTAVLDVYETEPLEADSPLRQMDNVILIPHMGGPTSDLYETCGAAMAEEIRRFQAGEPLQFEISSTMVQFMTANG